MVLNLNVSEDLTLGTEEFDYSNFTNYNTNILIIEATTNMTGFELHNSLGQQVLSSKLSSNLHNVDLNNYNTGIYFVKVSTANNIKSFKIVIK